MAVNGVSAGRGEGNVCWLLNGVVEMVFFVVGQRYEEQYEFDDSSEPDDFLV